MEEMRSSIREIAVKEIRGNTILALSVDSQELSRCEKAIREYGPLSPVVVRSVNGAYQVLAGECERMVLTRLRQKTMPAVVIDRLEDQDAALLTLLLSALKRSPTALSEGLLLRELCQEYRQSQTEIACLVGRSVSWVNKRLALAERLSKSVVDLVKAGQIPAGTAQEIARLPGDVQQVFAGRVVMDKLAKSAIEKLVKAYNDPDTPETVRQSVLQRPLDALPLLAAAQKRRGRRTLADISPEALAGQRMRNAIAMLFSLTKEAEDLLPTISPVDRLKMKQMLATCVDELWRFTRLAKAYFEDSNFSPGKNRDREVAGA